MDCEGYLFLTGRIKEIINRGGEKISPREVDEVLLDHPAVAQALTFVFPHPKLGEEVGAVVVLRDGQLATERELREFTARRLSDFKVPRVIVFQDQLPKSATGKLQRIGLAEKLGVRWNPPAIPANVPADSDDPLPAELARIWSEVLRIPDVGIHDNFFDAGGDSVLAAQIISRIYAATGKTISFLEFFDAPTIAASAQILRSQPAAHPATPTEVASPTSLSPAQQRMWFLQQLDPRNAAYNRPALLRLRGELDVARLERALEKMMCRHEALRTIFPSETGQPARTVLPAQTLPTHYVEITADRLQQHVREQASRSRPIHRATRPRRLVSHPCT